MATNGIMQDIRTLLSQGQSISQVIALGHKPSTVYKVQRQLGQQQQRNGTAPTPEMAQDQPLNGQEVPEELTNGDDEFFQMLFGPVAEPSESDILRAELNQARS